ncbi:LysR family transcriptional regulator, partial [uncultured Actinomyces sp.]|uniref:LysR family transcriptional regulator n=1 Tax=uncultured Actinomyces sp. TaxID=249061 RepID=UPI0028D63661
MHVLPQRLSVLLAVHRAGGVVAAADILHITPSAVSQQIRQLERECGARVLDRTPAGAVLTAAGRVLADAAERIENELTTVRRELADLDDSIPSGVVRVGSFASA